MDPVYDVEPKKSKILQALEDKDTSAQFTDPLENEMIINMVRSIRRRTVFSDCSLSSTGKRSLHRFRSLDICTADMRSSPKTAVITSSFPTQTATVIDDPIVAGVQRTLMKTLWGRL